MLDTTNAPIMCSCIICQKQYNVHSFHTHIQRVHDCTQTNYKGQNIKANIASKIAAATKRNAKLVEYNESPKYCKQCNKILHFDARRNKFCSSSCSASYTNAQRDYTKYKPGPPKFVGPKLPKQERCVTTKQLLPPFTKVKPCEMCRKLHPKPGKTCSTQCKNDLLKVLVNARIDAGWNPQEHRNRSTPSYLERSFKHWLLTQNITNFIQNKTFRCGRKIYYGDFFFPEKNVLIELDGSQHLANTEYDSARDAAIEQYYGTVTIRVTHKEYLAKTKQVLVESLIR